MKRKEIIINKIKENKGYITSKELKDLGINRFYISDLVKNGILERVKNGLYKDIEFIPENELTLVSRIVPDGVICLASAIEYYGLTTTIPFEYQVALPRNKKIVLPDYPPIKLFYFSDKNYYPGITELSIEGNIVKIYDIEKTICDVTKYRNKIGKNIFNEVLKEYVKREDVNINKILDYAKKMNSYKVLKESLELLI